MKAFGKGNTSLFLCVTTSIVALTTPAIGAEAAAEKTVAQAGDNFDDNDIIVTARRREETLQAVPVTVAAASGAALRDRGVTNLEGFARTIPQLFLADSAGSVQGGAIGIRGISASDGNVFGDQTVAFNIDGVLIARSTPRMFSSFDIQQVQVYKGPQALYFGKNSPGGVVTIKTADPTDHLEAGATGSYEFNAKEWRGEGFISGLIADGLSARLAVNGAKMRGWQVNVGTQGTPYSVARRDLPKSDEFGGRITLKFDKGGPLTARFKFNYGNLQSDGGFASTQRVFCPLGTPQLGGPSDCVADDRVDNTSLGTRFASGGANTVTGANIPGVYVFGDGVPFQHSEQYLAGLELNYELTDTLSVTSTTGYYDTSIELLGNANSADALFAFNPAAGAAAASGILATYQDLTIREISQELRLTSDFEGPVNFMAGGYYQDQKLTDLTALAVNALNPIQLFPPETLKQGGVAYSAFASVSYKPTDTIELSGGARYSHEKKKFSIFRLLPGTLPASQGGASYVAGQQVPTIVPQRSFNNVSPEATLSWKPNSLYTVYASWKRGFLSGGYNGSGTGTNVAVVGDFSYDQETVQGFEGGVKAALLDRSLQLNFAVFDYIIKGLQVSSTLPGPPPIQIVSNAASASSKGAEANFNWETPATGLSLHGAIAYNKARYKRFVNSPCYGGQTISAGCNVGFNGTIFTAQDLSGHPIARAPNWGGSIGAAYEYPMAGGGVLAFAADGNYTTGYYTDAVNSPGGFQGRYWLLDASARYKMANGVELGLIGRNLTNKYYFQRSGAATFTGTPSGFATSTLPDQIGYVSRGRELRLQLSFRFR